MTLKEKIQSITSAKVKIVKENKDPLLVSILRESTADLRQYLNFTEPTKDIKGKKSNPGSAKHSKDGPCRAEKFCCRDAEVGADGSTHKVKTECGNEINVGSKAKKPWSQTARELLGQRKDEQAIYVKNALQKNRATEDDLSDVPGASTSRTALLGKVQNLTGPSNEDESAPIHVNVYDTFESGLKSSSSVDISKKIIDLRGGGEAGKDSKTTPCRVRDCCRFEGLRNPNYLAIVPSKPAIPKNTLKKRTRDFPGIKESTGKEMPQQGGEGKISKQEKQNVLPISKQGKQNVLPISKQGKQNVLPISKQGKQNVLPISEQEEHTVLPISKQEEQTVLPVSARIQQAGQSHKTKIANDSIVNKAKLHRHGGYTDRKVSGIRPPKVECPKKRTNPVNVPLQQAGFRGRRRSSCADAMSPCDCGLTTKHDCPEEQMARGASFGMRNSIQSPVMANAQQLQAGVRGRKRSSCADAIAMQANEKKKQSPRLDADVPCECGLLKKRNCPEEKTARKASPAKRPVAVNAQQLQAGFKDRNRSLCSETSALKANQRPLWNSPPPYQAEFRGRKRSSCADALAPCDCGLTTRNNCPDEQMAHREVAMQLQAGFTNRRRSSCADAPCDCGLTTRRDCPEEQMLMADAWSGLDPCDCGQTTKGYCPEEQGFQSRRPANSLLDNSNANDAILGFYKTTTRDILRPENLLQTDAHNSLKQGVGERSRRERAMMTYEAPYYESERQYLQTTPPRGVEPLIKNTAAHREYLGNSSNDRSLTSFLAEDLTVNDITHRLPKPNFSSHSTQHGEREAADVTDDDKSILQTRADTSVQCVSALYPCSGERPGDDARQYNSYIEKYDVETQYDNLSLTSSSNFSTYSTYRELLREEVRDMNKASRIYRKIATSLLILNIFFLLAVIGLCTYVVLQHLELEKIFKETQDIVMTCATKYGKS